MHISKGHSYTSAASGNFRALNCLTAIVAEVPSKSSRPHAHLNGHRVRNGLANTTSDWNAILVQKRHSMFILLSFAVAFLMAQDKIVKERHYVAVITLD